MSNASVDPYYLIDKTNTRVTVLGPSDTDGYTRVQFEDGTENTFPSHAVCQDTLYALVFEQKDPTEFDAWDFPRQFTQYFDDKAAADAWLLTDEGRQYTAVRSYIAGRGK